MELENKTKVGRPKHKCPFPSCSAEVVHLPRHMRQVHKWCKSKANSVLSAFDLRNSKVNTSGKRKRVFKRKICPFHKCNAVVKRMHNHLTDVHHLKTSSEKYRKALKAAVLHDPETEPVETETSEELSDSTDEKSIDEDYLLHHIPPKKQRKSQHPSIFRSVYSTDDDEDEGVQWANVKPIEEGDFVGVNQGSDDEDGNHGNGVGMVCVAENAGVNSGTSFLAGNVGVNQDISDKNDGDCYNEIDQCGNDDDVGNDHEDAGDDCEDVSDDGNDHDDDDDDPSRRPDTIFPTNSAEKISDSIMKNVFSRKETDELMSKFENWLKGPDGGRKDDKSATQFKRQVQMVMEFIEPEKCPNLLSLMSKNILRDQWLTKFEKQKRPGTVKSYLGALNQFYIFLQAECAKIYSKLNVSEADLVSLSNQVKLWAKSSRKMGENRFWEKRMDDLANKKTPQDVSKFDLSEVARNAVKIIGNFNDTNEEQILTQAEYTNVRDYLMTILCINNGSRAGSLANMTLDEFKNASLEDDCYVVHVKKHKTFTTHGPVNMVFSSTLYKYVELFISKMRNRLPDVDLASKHTVFLTWKGCEMDSSHVGAQIGACWGKVFGKDAAIGGATSFRKAAVSAVQESNKEMREDLANLMVHNRTTADRYYLLQDKSKTAVRTSKELSRIMRQPDSSNSSVLQCADKASTSCHESSQDVAVRSLRKKWGRDETAAVQTVFAKHIQDMSISLEEVRQLSKDHPILSKISCTKMRDKIRSLFCQNDVSDSDNPLTLPNESETPQQRMQRFGIPSTSG